MSNKEILTELLLRLVKDRLESLEKRNQNENKDLTTFNDNMNKIEKCVADCNTMTNKILTKIKEKAEAEKKKKENAENKKKGRSKNKSSDLNKSAFVKTTSKLKKVQTAVNFRKTTGPKEGKNLMTEPVTPSKKDKKSKIEKTERKDDKKNKTLKKNKTELALPTKSNLSKSMKVKDNKKKDENNETKKEEKTEESKVEKKEDSKEDKKEDKKEGTIKKEEKKKEDTKKDDKKKEDTKKSTKKEPKKDDKKKEDKKEVKKKEEKAPPKKTGNTDSKGKSDKKNKESKKEESKTEESKKEESKPEESKKEESKPEEPKKEESKPEEPKKEEPKKEDETNKEEPKKEEPISKSNAPSKLSSEKFLNNYPKFDIYFTNNDIFSLIKVNKQFSKIILTYQKTKFEKEVPALEQKIKEFEEKYKDKQSEYEGSVPNFALGKAGLKAVGLLNEKKYLELFEKEEIPHPDIIFIYRIFLVFLNKTPEIESKNNEEFWKFTKEYIIKESNSELGKYFDEQMKNLNFSKEILYKISNLIQGSEKKLTPLHFSKQCPCQTTGLVVFLLKEALEYAGILENKKPVLANIYNLMKYKLEMMKKKQTLQDNLLAKLK